MSSLRAKTLELGCLSAGHRVIMWLYTPWGPPVPVGCLFYPQASFESSIHWVRKGSSDTGNCVSVSLLSPSLVPQPTLEQHRMCRTGTVA
jgi:hypothetical protein